VAVEYELTGRGQLGELATLPGDSRAIDFGRRDRLPIVGGGW